MPWRPPFSAAITLMEAFTYHTREPHRGDLVAFKTEGLSDLPSSEIYVKRVIGEPGEHLRITDGHLFINEKETIVSGAFGSIFFVLPPLFDSARAHEDLTIPAGHYFVVGDNTTNSADSRMWGPVPRGNIIGRIVYRYAPLSRMGALK